MIWMIVIWYMVQRVEVVLGEQRTEACLGSALGVEDKGNNQAMKWVSVCSRKEKRRVVNYP